jgi:hypothetical protein
MIKENLGYLQTPLSYSVPIVIVYALLILPSTTFNPLTTVFAQVPNNQPNIHATSVYDTGQMVLPDNVKYLVIVIPNEGHHGPGEDNEARFIAQPFVPQNVVATTGTEVVLLTAMWVMNIILS